MVAKSQQLKPGTTIKLKAGNSASATEAAAKLKKPAAPKLQKKQPIDDVNLAGLSPALGRVYDKARGAKTPEDFKKSLLAISHTKVSGEPRTLLLSGLKDSKANLFGELYTQPELNKALNQLRAKVPYERAFDGVKADRAAVIAKHEVGRQAALAAGRQMAARFVTEPSPQTTQQLGAVLLRLANVKGESRHAVFSTAVAEALAKSKPASKVGVAPAEMTAFLKHLMSQIDGMELHNEQVRVKVNEKSLAESARAVNSNGLRSLFPLPR